MMNNEDNITVCEMSCSHNNQWSNHKIYNGIVIGILMPFIGSMGIILNAANVYLFTRPCLLNSINCYLCALAVSDTIIGLTAIVLYSLLVAECTTPFISEFHSAVAPTFFPLSTVAQTCSVYFTVGAAVDCFISTLLSDKRRKSHCTIQRAVIIILITSLCSFMYNATHWLELDPYHCFSPIWNTTITRLGMTDFRQNEIYFEIYYTYLYTICMTVGPLIVLLILNTFIVLKVICVKSVPSNTNPGSSGDTIMLVLVIFLFIICNSLSLIINVLESVKPDLGLSLTYLIDLSNLLVVCNSSCNFLIYYTFGDNFKRCANSYSCSTSQNLDGQLTETQSLLSHGRRRLTIETELVLVNLQTSALYAKL